MPELIDRYATMDAIPAPTDADEAEYYGKVCDAIETIPTVNRWIPCSERLPENDAKCLVYTSDKRICMAKWNEKYDGQGAWYIISDYAPKLYRIKNVPFWMPLPDPPEGGADNAVSGE